ncbi:MAG: hypothetical protein AAF750_10255 [Planctomycetota bacterium]
MFGPWKLTIAALGVVGAVVLGWSMGWVGVQNPGVLAGFDRFGGSWAQGANRYWVYGTGHEGVAVEAMDRFTYEIQTSYGPGSVARTSTRETWPAFGNQLELIRLPRQPLMGWLADGTPMCFSPLGSVTLDGGEPTLVGINGHWHVWRFVVTPAGHQGGEVVVVDGALRADPLACGELLELAAQRELSVDQAELFMELATTPGVSLGPAAVQRLEEWGRGQGKLWWVTPGSSDGSTYGEQGLWAVPIGEIGWIRPLAIQASVALFKAQGETDLSLLLRHLRESEHARRSIIPHTYEASGQGVVMRLAEAAEPDIRQAAIEGAAWVIAEGFRWDLGSREKIGAALLELHERHPRSRVTWQIAKRLQSHRMVLPEIDRVMAEATPFTRHWHAEINQAMRKERHAVVRNLLKHRPTEGGPDVEARQLLFENLVKRYGFAELGLDGHVDWFYPTMDGVFSAARRVPEAERLDFLTLILSGDREYELESVVRRLLYSYDLRAVGTQWLAEHAEAEELQAAVDAQLREEASSRNHGYIRALVAQGAELNAGPPHPWTGGVLGGRQVEGGRFTVLAEALRSSNYETQGELLIALGANPQHLFDLGQYIARPEKLDWLIRHGLDIEHQYPNGRSLLTYAISRQRDRTVRKLLQLGADPHKPDATGASAVDLVRAFPRGLRATQAQRNIRSQMDRMLAVPVGGE